MSRLFGSVVIAALSALTVTVSCGGDDSSDNSGGAGGTSASSGGASAHGGKSNSNAGASTTGGSPEAGATSEGGAATTSGGAANQGGATNQGGSPVAEGGTGDSGAPSGGTPSTNGGTAGNVGVGGKAPLTMSVTTPNNTLALDNCGAISPAAFTAVEAGTYDITLKSSTLSKGSVSDDDGNPIDAFDNYVIVNLPLPAGDANEKYRFFMLHGADDKMTVTLPEAGDIKLFFIDADKDYNSGQATVTLTPPGSETVVDAITNVIPWSSCLDSAPATLAISARPQKVTLVSSTLSSGAQMHDDFVILRVQNEMQVNEHRYTMLNGVGSSYTFTPYKGDYLRAWFISASGGGSGTAKIEVQEL